MKTCALSSSLCLGILALATGCPQPPPISSLYCPISTSDPQPRLSTNDLTTLFPKRDAASLLDNADRQFVAFEQRLTLTDDGSKGAQANLQMEEALINYGTTMREAIWVAYGEAYDVATSPANRDPPVILSRLRSTAKQHAQTLRTFAVLWGKKKTALTTPAGSLQIRQLQSMLVNRSRWQHASTATLRTMAGKLISHVNSVLVPNASADPANCYDSCMTMDWKSCALCLENMGTKMPSLWDHFCMEWNDCTGDLDCDVKRMKSLATLLQAIADAAGS